mmetsp:Transcript_92435/g.238640  ORF Transcript_92435/g.238640 Transcript_92435/m.238640 type:complete len:340 (-) Transcript_92435:454-1473(-)
MHGQASSPVGVAEVVVVEVAVQHTSNTQEPKEMREAPAADDGAAMSEGGAEDTVVQSAERASESRGSGSATPVALFRHSTQRTTWRWPQRPGELPVYIQQRFRSKVFLVVGLQLAVVLLMMCLMDFCIHEWLASIPSGILFCVFAMSSIAFLVALSVVSLSERHTLSYVLLLLWTLSTGCCWGIVRLGIMDTWFQYQALGIPCVTMLLSAAIAAATPNVNVDPTTLLYVTVMPAWAVGAVVVTTTSVMLPIPGAASSLVVAVGYTAGLTSVLLRLDIGHLRKPDLDEFVGAIVRMDIALLPLGLAIPVTLQMGMVTLGLEADDRESRRDTEAARDTEAV